MSKNTTTAPVVVATEEALLDAARAAYALLKRVRGLRPQAALAFLGATTATERQDAVDEWGAGFVRRALREAAVAFERKDDEETANAFWLLRDSIDEQDGDVLFTEDEDDDIVWM